MQGPSGSVFRAIVLGPSQLRLREEDAATATPELLLLAALCHGEERPVLVEKAVASLASLDDEQVRAYFDLLRYRLGDAFERALRESLMTTGEQKYLSDFARKYYGEGRTVGKAEGVVEGRTEGVLEGRAEGVAQGKAEGTREALLTVLGARSIPLTDAQRATLDTTSDVATLERWLTRAARAETASEIFDVSG